jgi:hypothetical protein
MMLLRKLSAASCVMFTTRVASIHLVNVSMPMNKNLKPPGDLERIPMMSIPQIDGSKRVCMIRSLLLVELALFTLGDDFHHVILTCRPVESVP